MTDTPEMQAQRAIEALAEIEAACAHCAGAENPDTIRASMDRVANIAGGYLLGLRAAPEPVALPPWGLFEGEPQPLGGMPPGILATRTAASASAAAALHDMMADTVDDPAMRAVAAEAEAAMTATAAAITDAEWRAQTLQLSRDAIAQAEAHEAAAARWRTESEASAASRHAAAQGAATARAAAHLDAIAAASRGSWRDRALQVLTMLPADMPLADKRRALHAHLELLALYPDEPGQALPPAPAAVPEPAPEPAPVPAPAPVQPHPSPAPVPAASITPAEFARRAGFDFFYARHNAPAEGWAEMRDMGATLARCWYMARWQDGRYVVPPEDVQRMRDGVQQALQHGLVPVLCLDVLAPDMPLGLPERCAAFVDCWAGLERAHADQPQAVFDILNEPRPRDGKAHGTHYSEDQQAVTNRDGRDLMLLVTGALRALNPSRLIVAQLGLGADPAQFATQHPLPMPQVVHSAHLYLPHSYTHHGVPQAVAGQAVPLPLPVWADAQPVLDAALARLGEWSDAHDSLPVYVGETGAHAALPDAHLYVGHAGSYCRARGWPWCYHELRGDPVWQPSPATQETLRKLLAA